jgi:hypothetical protein
MSILDYFLFLLICASGVSLLLICSELLLVSVFDRDLQSVLPILTT